MYALHFQSAKLEQNYLIFLTRGRFYAFYLCQVNPAERERDFAVPFSAMSTNVRSISLILIFPNLIRSTGSCEKNVLGLINSKFDKESTERHLLHSLISTTFRDDDIAYFSLYNSTWNMVNI